MESYFTSTSIWKTNFEFTEQTDNYCRKRTPNKLKTRDLCKVFRYDFKGIFIEINTKTCIKSVNVVYYLWC
jgi:hypothetical protein